MDRLEIINRFLDWGLDLRSLLLGFLIGLAICYLVVDMADNCMPQGTCRFNDGKTGDSYDFNCKELLPLMCDQNILIPDYINDKELFKVVDLNHPEIATTSQTESTTTTQIKATTTTSTTIKQCPQIPDCICNCPICTKCQTCTFEPTPEQIHWMLNYKPNQGSSAYQAGGFDTKDEWLEYLQIPGRPKFKSRPSTLEDAHIYTGYAQAEKDCLISFKDEDCNGDFYLNNSIWMISGEGHIKWIHKL